MQTPLSSLLAWRLSWPCRFLLKSGKKTTHGFGFETMGGFYLCAYLSIRNLPRICVVDPWQLTIPPWNGTLFVLKRR